MSKETVEINLDEISVEDDLDKILKTSFGGYTKASVQGFLAAAKKQKEAFGGEIERLQQEVRTLKDALAEATKKNEETERESVRMLEEQKLRMRAEFEEENVRIRSEYDELQSDLEESRNRVGSHAATIRELEQKLEDAEQTIELTKRDVSTNQILLDTANRRLEDFNRILAEKDEENLFLKQTGDKLREALDEETSSEVYERIQVQIEKIDLLQHEISLRDQELDNRARRIETYARQEKSHQSALDELQLQIQKLLAQNEWMSSENDELSQRMQAQMAQIIEVSRDCAHLKAANAIMQRKLDYCMTKRLMPEVQEAPAEPVKPENDGAAGSED